MRKKLVASRLIFLIAGLVPFSAAASDCKSDEVVIGERGTSGTCANEFPQGTCVKSGAIFFFNGSDWVVFDGQSISTRPTNKWSKSGPKQFEFLYVADLRFDPVKPAVIGVLAARATNRRYTRINIFRNELDKGSIPEINSYSRKTAYQSYMVPNYSGTRFSDLDKWLKVPGYWDANDVSKRHFRYDDQFVESGFWNISMKIRTVGGVISCTPFRLGYSSAITDLELKFFTQSSPEKYTSVSAGVAELLR